MTISYTQNIVKTTITKITFLADGDLSKKQIVSLLGAQPTHVISIPTTISTNWPRPHYQTFVCSREIFEGVVNHSDIQMTGDYVINITCYSLGDMPHLSITKTQMVDNLRIASLLSLAEVQFENVDTPTNSMLQLPDSGSNNEIAVRRCAQKRSMVPGFECEDESKRIKC